MTAPATISGLGPAVPTDPPGAARALSITDFLTDGSLPATCDELTRLTGVGVSLLDHAGRRVVHATGPVAWTVSERPEAGDGAPGAFVVPIVADGATLGSLRVESGAPRLGGAGGRASLEGTVRLLAETAAGFCRQDLELRHRVKEIKALARLSSLLARATDVRAVLDIALESALDVLALDAGSIVLFEKDEGVRAENEADLVLLASRNLSREWLDCPSPASKGRLFDRLALKGEIVASEDLLADDRVLIPDLVRSEGLRGFINCGLLFQDKPIGVIRLYARTPRTFGDADRRLLRSIAHQAAVAVEQARLLKVREQDDRMQRQLQLARDVQRRMLPRRIPSVARLDVAAKYEPSFALGGDFYDLFELSENLGIAIGDVVGKGIAAALLMSAVRASLRAHVQDLYHLDDAIQRVNIAMTRDLLDNEFATLWYGVVEPAKLRLTYCSAGHEPPFIVRVPPDRSPGPAEVDELSIGGMAVGIDPTQRYQRGTYDLHPGDMLVAYTDGLPDALDFSGRRYGKPRLRQAVLSLLASEPRAPAARVIEHLFWELRQHTGLLQRPDDQTIVVVRVKD